MKTNWELLRLSLMVKLSHFSIDKCTIVATKAELDSFAPSLSVFKFALVLKQ